jgi:transcriptional regulator with XRE-family HTH domain
MAKSFDALVKRSTSKRTRDRAAVRTRELLAELPVGALRQLVGKSQRELAMILGIKQPSISKLENQSDMQISTLQKIVEALGGELDLVARFPKGAVKLGQFARPSKRPKRSRSAVTELQLF